MSSCFAGDSPTKLTQTLKIDSIDCKTQMRPTTSRRWSRPYLRAKPSETERNRIGDTHISCAYLTHIRFDGVVVMCLLLEE